MAVPQERFQFPSIPFGTSGFQDSGDCFKQSFGSSCNTFGPESTQPGVQPSSFGTAFGQVSTQPSSFRSNNNIFGSNSGTRSQNFGSSSPVTQTPSFGPLLKPSSYGSNVFGPNNGTAGQNFGSSSSTVTQTPGFGSSTPSFGPLKPSSFGSNVFGSNDGTVGQNIGSSSSLFGTPISTRASITNPNPVSSNVFGSNDGTVGHIVGSSNPVPGIPIVHGAKSIPETPNPSSSNVFGSTSPVPGTPFVQGPALTPGFGFSSTPALGPSIAPAVGWFPSPSFNGGWNFARQRGSSIYPYCSTAATGEASGTGSLNSVSAMNVYCDKSHEELRFEDYQLQRNKDPVMSNNSNCQTPPKSIFSSSFGQDHSNPVQALKSNGPSVQPSQSNASNVFPGFQVPYQPGSNAANCSGFGFVKPTSASQTSGTSSYTPRTGPFSFENFNGKNVQSNSFAQTIPMVHNTATGKTTQAQSNQNTQPFAVYSFPAFISFIQPATMAVPAQHFGLFGPTVASFTPMWGTQISPATLPFSGPFTNWVGFTGPNAAHSTPLVSVASPVMGLYGAPSVGFSGPIGGYYSNGAPSNTPASVANPGIGLFSSPSVGFSGPNGGYCSNGAPSNPVTNVANPGMALFGVQSVGFSGPNNCSNGAPSNTPANVANPGFGSFGSPSTSFVGFGHSSTSGALSTVLPLVATSPFVRQPERPNTSFVGFGHSSTNGDKCADGAHSTAPPSSFGGPRTTCAGCCCALFGIPSDKGKEADEEACLVPKGLEVISEKLGFNPFSHGKDDNKHDDYEVKGEILPCEEADKDDDIIALAEFAVEQHNALHKDEEVGLLKVVVACLEAVGGGRYHIVVEAVVAGVPKRCYAVVLRKGTERPNHLTVLEKWLPSQA